VSQQLRVQIEQIGPATATATARSHRVVVDRPVAKGGEDRGPLGGEYLLVALGGCFTSNLLAAIRAREAAMSDIRIDVSGTLEGPPDRFTAFALDVSAVCQDASLAGKLIGIASRACAVTNTLRQTAPVTFTFQGTQISVDP
jgi:putative redox protein